MNLLLNALQRRNRDTPPVWFMRQAGRYHSHYQALRKRFSFVELCKTPELACEVTLGPIQAFDFDAAILFSDLLFPLEAMGLNLSYGETGPKLNPLVETLGDVRALRGGAERASTLNFQARALELLRPILPAEKGLIGFVGAPLTLFFYAAAGSHRGNLEPALAGLRDGRYEEFCRRLEELLVANILSQIRGGADAMAVFDTCAGDLSPALYRDFATDPLRRVLDAVRSEYPYTPIIYYSKGTGPEHWDSLLDFPIDCLGIDWTHDLGATLERYGHRWAIQGNLDPHLLAGSSDVLSSELGKLTTRMKQLPAEQRAGWVFNLGHGVLPGTPEENVKSVLRDFRKEFAN